MLYTVTIKNGEDSVRIHDRYERIAEAKITRERNSIDCLTFTIYPDNPGYEALNRLTTTIEVVNGKTGKVDFEGRVVKAPAFMDSDGTIGKSVTCEGVEAYLCDSVQPYLAEQQWSGDSSRNGLQQFIDYVLARHNERVEDHKKVYRGVVDLITYQTSQGVYKGLQRDSTRETLQSKLVDVFGGEMRVRRSSDDGKLYLDYSEKLGDDSSTTIELAQNMASATLDEEPTQVITRLYPLGKKPDGSDDYLTIASVNSGKEYIEDADAKAVYGVIEGTHIWEDMTVAANLKSAAQSWLPINNQFPTSAAVDAYDLSLIDLAPEEFRLYDWYQVKNSLIGLDQSLEVVKQVIDINEPHNSTIELGDSTYVQSSKATAAIASRVKVLEKMLGI